MEEAEIFHPYIAPTFLFTYYLVVVLVMRNIFVAIFIETIDGPQYALVVRGSAFKFNNITNTTTWASFLWEKDPAAHLETKLLSH